MVQVKVTEGILEGEQLENDYGNSFYSFKGIPYAEPPLSDLRFKAPRPKQPWPGVYQAKTHGPMCYQIDFFTRQTPDYIPSGSEDCLYLNVYTPDIKPEKPLAVMVYIHGGGFMSGCGNHEVFGPEFLVKNDVILVTLNYRLEVVGFLSLDTKELPGNAGMKDQVLALKWIKKNIGFFGGDSDNMTIFGESAGAASVSYHLVSPMSKGLFNRAIMQSGTITCPWAISRLSAREKAFLLARQMGCESNNEKEVYEFFKRKPIEDLIVKQVPLTYTQYTRIWFSVYFTVVSEKHFDGEERFFAGDVYDVLRDGIHEGVQVINGYVEDEGTVLFAKGLNIKQLLEQANGFYELYVPQPLELYCTPLQQLEIGKRVRNFYLRDTKTVEEVVNAMIRFIGMDYFKYGASMWQKICAQRNKNQIYSYRFSCNSERNVFTSVFGTEEALGYKRPVSHSDDLAYLFPLRSFSSKVHPNSTSYKMIETVSTLWTNFAKYGDPTRDNSFQAKWEPYTIEKQQYLDIGETLRLKTKADKEEIDFWENIFQEYYPHMSP
ncbi:unnamed protein product [Leptosia nina]|uniref:Carboxylic ester hydrolase n=1 Tax=Leptosia nina TaxID=320188 RepID=A0AAV1K1Z8_9NEOP